MINISVEDIRKLNKIVADEDDDTCLELRNNESGEYPSDTNLYYGCGDGYHYPIDKVDG